MCRIRCHYSSLFASLFASCYVPSFSLQLSFCPSPLVAAVVVDAFLSQLRAFHTNLVYRNGMDIPLRRPGNNLLHRMRIVLPQA